MFIGDSTGICNILGINNTLLGHNSGLNNFNGSHNVFIGYQSGYNEIGSNKLYISNSNSSNPLVYGEFDNSKLQVNGSLHISDFAKLKPGNPPNDPSKGTIYYDVTDDKVKVWTGSIWENLN